MAGVVLLGTVTLSLLWTLFGPTHLEEVDVESITPGTPNGSPIPTPIKGNIIEVGNLSKYEPHFPFSDFHEARAWARRSSFQMIIRGKLSKGTYVVSVKNSATHLLLPLAKVAPDLYVSPPIIILSRDASSTYFFGYNILRQDPGTEGGIDSQVERVVRGSQ